MSKDQETVKVSYTFDENLKIESSSEDIVVAMANIKINAVQIKAVSENLFGYRPRPTSQSEIVESISRLKVLAECLSEECIEALGMIFKSEGESK